MKYYSIMCLLGSILQFCTCNMLCKSGFINPFNTCRLVFYQRAC